jgi:hypothetical protein
MGKILGEIATPGPYSTMEPNYESHNSLRNSNAKSLSSTLDKGSLSSGNKFRPTTLTTSQPSQLDLQGDASTSSYCEECFYCPECSDHSDCESCVDCETCIECDDCEIMMETTRRYTTGMRGEVDGIMHYNNTTSLHSAPLQHSGDDGWMDLVNIPQDADVTGDQNSPANDAALGGLKQDASTIAQSGLLSLDDNNASNFSTGFPTTGGYTEGASHAATRCYLVAEPFIELRLLNPPYLFGIGQQFDGIPSNYGDKAAISASPTLAIDDDTFFRRIFQAAGIVNAAVVGGAKMPAMQLPLPAYLPAQPMPVTYPANNNHDPPVTTRPVTTRLATRPPHARKARGNSPAAKKTCAYCPDKGPFDASGLAKHNNSLEHQKARGAANPTKKYACPYCGRRFPRQDHIKRHVLKVFKRANGDANNNVVVVAPKCPVLQKRDADGEQGAWEWELEGNGSYALLKDREGRNPFKMPVGYKANMKRTYGGRHGQ